MSFTFVDAVKEQEKARIALDGPSGSGKTWTALSLAQGLGQRIAVIDTERRSARKYADIFAFKTLEMHAYDPRDLVKALAAAADGGFDVVIIDSLSHFWMGTDGMLEQVDRVAKRSPSGNSWGAWKDVTPIEKQMIDAMLSFPGHVIATMRTKTEWVVGEDDRGRKSPQKIGLKAEQRAGIEYEFDIVGDLDLAHNLVVSKSRMATLADRVVEKPDAELGAEILQWLSDGTKVPSVQDYVDRTAAATTLDELRVIFEEVQHRGIGAAPCTIEGHAMTLRQYIVGRANLLKAAQEQPQQPPASPQQPAPVQEDPRLADLRTKVVVLVAKKLGITDRDTRLAAVAKGLRLNALGSFKELSGPQMLDIIAALTKRPDYVPPVRYGELHAQIDTATLEGLHALEHSAVEARDAGQISGEQWQQLSDLIGARSEALIADAAGEGAWDQAALQEPVGAGA